MSTTDIPFTSAKRCDLIRRQEAPKIFDNPNGNLNTTESPQIINSNLTFSPKSYAYYQDLSKACVEKTTPPFILLDCKSLPRSGLHYMKKTFANLLGDNFSFCEWYHEPGCCRKMPCALTGYAEQSRKEHSPKLRLVKSHDFLLDDPVYTPIYCLRRMILIRDPLFILTSWFCLDQLDEHKQFLQFSDLNVDKIWFSHETELLATAYQIIDKTFVAPNSDTLLAWLEEKKNYILGFLTKWVKPEIENPQFFLHVVKYEEINSFIVNLLFELRMHLSEETIKRIDAFSQRGVKNFNIRNDPYHSPSKKLTAYMIENSYAFQATANIILTDPICRVLSICH
jgi:hypothetical protein